MRRISIISFMVIGLFIAGRAYFPTHYFTLDYIQHSKLLFLSFIETHYYTALFIYLITFMSSTLLALPTTTVLIMAAGFLFPLWHAFLINSVCLVLAAFIAFYTTRIFFGALLQKKYKNRLTRFNTHLQKEGVPYLLGLRLIPLIPFASLNILAGLTTLPTRTFLWTTFVGSLPGLIIFTYLGSQLAQATTWRAIFTPPLIIIMLILLALGLWPVIKSTKRRQKRPI